MADIVRLDEILLASYDEAVRGGAARGGSHVTCRLGCTDCCIGMFDVTALDAARLKRGLEELERDRPLQASSIRERSRIQWNEISGRFPGDAGSGILDQDDDARDHFCSELEELPCPVLEPETGACLLYEYRPLTCRSYGLPVIFGGEALPPCPLNFTSASPEEIEAAMIEPDPNDEEGRILARMPPGDTVIAAALGN